MIYNGRAAFFGRFITLWAFTVHIAMAGPGWTPGTGAGAEPTRREMLTESQWETKRDHFKDKVSTISHRVAELRKRLEEWGSVTVSAPLIMKEIGDFNLGKDEAFPRTLEYINLALNSAQGGVSQSTQTAFSNEFQLTVTPTFKIDPLTGAKQARTTPDGTGDGLSPDDVAQGPQFDITGVLAGGTAANGKQFAAPGTLIIGPNGQKELKPGANGASALTAPSSFTLSGAQAAMIGSNAKISELLIRQMADPKQRLFTNPHYSIHFVIVQVSCNPGWRTRENYIADVSATTEYYALDELDRNCAEPLPDGQEKLHFDNSWKKPAPGYPKSVEQPGFRPRVFSVLPLIDAQTLELLNSERRFTQLAASLSAAFPTAAANLKGRDIMQFVKQFQKDTQTVTPRTVANSYSSGAIFGFRLMPSLTALKDPARSGSKPANILQATTFPVLVTVVTSKSDATKLKADSVRVRIANRWLINDRPPFKEVWRRVGLPLWRESTKARLDLALMFGEAESDVKALREDVGQDDPYNEAVLTLERDLHELRQKVIGSDTPTFPLPACIGKRQRDPAARNPVIQRIIPEELTAQGRAAIFIGGLNFFPKAVVDLPFVRGADDRLDTGIRVFLGPVEGTVLATDGDEQMVVQFKDLEKLADLASAPIVVSTRFGNVAWGSAIRIVKPDASKSKTPSATVAAESLDPAGQATTFNLVASGANLAGVKSANLKEGGAKAKVTFSGSETTVVLLKLDTPVAADGTREVTLQLYKSTNETGDILVSAKAKLVPNK